MNLRFPTHLRQHSGMTLIELVVVLALLAGLASLALTGVSDLGNRARYDETTTRLKLIRLAVIGDGVEVGRFVRDMGRLPKLYHTNGGVRLEELWRDEGNISYGPVTISLISGVFQWPDYDTFTTNLPSSAALTFGWNGPYLMVDNPTDAQTYDGFGNAWEVETNAAGEILKVLSLGAEGAEGGVTWDEVDRANDLESLLPMTELTVLIKARDSTNAQGAVWKTVEAANASEVSSNTPPYQLHKLCVALFTPTNGVELCRQLRLAMVPDVSGSVTFTNLMPTECLICAYGTNAVSGLQTSGSAPELVTLKPGRNTVILYLTKP
jgi:prepilin-type N-terminal cleavage/methylation domain-containing protein